MRLQHGVLRGCRRRRRRGGAADDLPRSTLTAPPRGTNSLVHIGERAVLKLYRRLWPGTHPEIEALQFLTERAHFARVPAAWAASTTCRMSTPRRR